MGQYLKKGRPVYIEGRIQTRSWDKDGAKQYRTEIVVDSFQFGPQGGGDGARGGTSYNQAAQAPAAAPAMPEISGEEIQYPDEEINPEDIPF